MTQTLISLIAMASAGLFTFVLFCMGMAVGIWELINEIKRVKK